MFAECGPRIASSAAGSTSKSWTTCTGKDWSGPDGLHRCWLSEMPYGGAAAAKGRSLAHREAVLSTRLRTGTGQFVTPVVYTEVLLRASERAIVPLKKPFLSTFSPREEAGTYEYDRRQPFNGPDSAPNLRQSLVCGVAGGNICAQAAGGIHEPSQPLGELVRRSVEVPARPTCHHSGTRRASGNGTREIS